jgi:RNA binding exosome subunit
MSLPISFIEIDVISHATEDENKVFSAIKKIITEQVFQEANIKKSKLDGHYGNPITYLSIRVYKKSLIKKIIENLLSDINIQDRELLLSNFDNRVDDEGNFFIRFDKQAAYLGELNLCETDPIRLKIKLTIPRKQREQIIEALKQIFKS